MNSENSNNWTREDEKFFEELSSMFEGRRDAAYIKESVSKVIQDSDFDEFEKIRKRNKLRNGIFYSLIGLFITAGIIYGGFRFASDDGQAVDKTEQNKITMTENIDAVNNDSPVSDKPAVKTEQPQQQESQVKNDETAMPPQDNAKAEKEQLTADLDKENIEPDNMEITTKRDKKLETKEIHYTGVTAYLDIGDSDPSQLIPDLNTVIKNTGLKAYDLSGGDFLLHVKSDEAAGYSKDKNKPVRFYLEFLITKDAPHLLKIKLNYTFEGFDQSRYKKDLVMEDLFYKKLTNELGSIFGK